MKIFNGFIFSQYNLHHRSSTGLYIGLGKYRYFQSGAKVKQIIAIVTTHSVSCFSYQQVPMCVATVIEKTTINATSVLH